MNRFLYDMKISRKLLLAPGIAILFLLICSLVSYSGLVRQKASITSIYSNDFQNYRKESDIFLHLSQTHANFHKVINMSNAKYDREKIEQFAAAQISAVDAAKESVRRRAAQTGITAEEAGLLKELSGQIDHYRQLAHDMVDMVTTDVATAVVYMDSLDAQYDVLDGVFNKVLALRLSQGQKSYAYAMKSFDHTTYSFCLLVIVGFALSLAVSFAMSRFITSPLQKAIGAIAEVAHGNLAVRVEAGGKDETGRLAEAVGEMKEKTISLVRSVKTAAETMSAASTRFSSSSEDMSHGARDQASKAAQVATAAEQMGQTIMEVARNTGEIAAAAGDTTVTARQGQDIVGKSVVEVGEIARTVNQTGDLVVSLGERSRQISKIVEVINDIAEQTNLLALNAAIEAARAGEQGRGFAVVADEVRKLADRTAKSTAEIDAMIRYVQADLDRVVTSMGDVRQRVELGVCYSGEAGTALQGIVTRAEALQTMVQRIASATEEMNATSEEITRDIAVIAAVSQQTSKSLEETVGTSVELGGLSDKLLQVVGEFRM